MSIKITIFDGAIPMLDKIASISYGLGLDALDQAGIELRNQTRRAFSMSGSHNWTAKIGKNGKRTIVKSGRQVFGKRLSHKTTKDFSPNNMKSFITSYLMERSLTMVVAGNHPNFRPKMRRNGKVVGSLRKVSGVTESTSAILQKLNDGGSTNEAYDKLTRSGKSMRGFKDAKYRPRRFIQKGRAMAMPKVRHIMTSKLEMLIAKQVNRTTIRAVERAS